MSSHLRFLCINDVYKIERFSQLKSMIDTNSINNSNNVTKIVLPGDFLGGSLYAGDHTGESVIQCMNCIDFDYITLGNHGK